MSKQFKVLPTPSFSSLLQEKHYAMGRVAGFYLYVAATGARPWVLQVIMGGKRWHIGLASYLSVSLTETFSKAESCCALVEHGIDTSKEHKTAKSRLMDKIQSAKTFQECVFTQSLTLKTLLSFFKTPEVKP